jgi:hypothetical protein
MKALTADLMKSRNLTWLVMLALLDMGLVLTVVVPELLQDLTLSRMTALRSAIAPVLPFVVLLLSNVIPVNLKAILVFWKLENPLPGSEAFTRHGPADPRVDMATLKKNVGAFPTDPTEQNAKWYRLYKMVENEGKIVEVQKQFLLFRDAAAMSLLLTVFTPPLLWAFGANKVTALCGGTVFAAQFLACAVSSRNNGIRFVTSVLAIHASRRVTTPRKTTTRGKAKS